MINILDICSIEVDPMIPAFTSALIEIIKYLVPVILIVLGVIDLIKAMVATDSNKMKGSIGLFFRRIVYSVLIYFVVALVQFAVNTLGKSGAANSNQLNACINCFVNNENCSIVVDTSNELNDEINEIEETNDLKK